jgi:hypothetical protein
MSTTPTPTPFCKFFSCCFNMNGIHYELYQNELMSDIKKELKTKKVRDLSRPLKEIEIAMKIKQMEERTNSF